MNKSNLREEIFKLVYSLEVQKEDESSQIDLYLENSELSDKEKEFLESCNKKTWTMIPEELSDPTNYQNFIEYVKFL